MTDTPPITYPPGRLDRIKAFIGDLARPFAIIVTSASAAVSGVVIASKVENGNDGAILMTAIGALVTGIYLGKAWEQVKTAQANAGGGA